MLTAADQDYVKAVFRLQSLGRTVSTSSLASLLGVTPASVSGMLRKLSRSKLLVHRRYRGARLTARGRRAAIEIIRRHRLVELFLVEVLKLPWDIVHEEAEKLEHAISDSVLDRIDELLGYPEFDPHGAPIPPSGGSFVDVRGTRLDRIEPGLVGRVCQVGDDDPAILRYLSETGLVPGAKVCIRDRLAFDGTVVLEVSGQRFNISPKVASAVWIEADKKKKKSK